MMSANPKRLKATMREVLIILVQRQKGFEHMLRIYDNVPDFIKKTGKVKPVCLLIEYFFGQQGAAWLLFLSRERSALYGVGSSLSALI